MTEAGLLRPTLAAAVTVMALFMGGTFWAVLRPAARTVSAVVAGDPIVRFRHQGELRTYRIHLPAGPAPDQPRPLVVALHGGGQDPAALTRMTDLNSLADRDGFVVVYPAGRHFRWNDGLTAAASDDVAFLGAVVERVMATARIDRRRVFLTGLSDGAVMAYRFACEGGGVVAAVAPVAGHLPVPVAQRCHGGPPTAVLAVAGTADKIIPFDGVPALMLSARASIELWAARNGCATTAHEGALSAGDEGDGQIRRIAYSDGCHGGADAVLLAVDGGGHRWPAAPGFLASEEIWAFFQTHPSAR